MGENTTSMIKITVPAITWVIDGCNRRQYVKQVKYGTFLVFSRNREDAMVIKDEGIAAKMAKLFYYLGYGPANVGSEEP